MNNLASPPPSPLLTSAPLKQGETGLKLNTKNKDGYETPGEKMFEDLVYNKMNFWLNLAGSLAFTESAEFGGNNPVSKGIRWMATEGKIKVAAGLEKLSISPSTAKKIGNGAVNILALGMVGHLLVLPIKFLEDDKLKYVKKLDAWLDDHHGRKPDEAELARREEAYKRIAEEKPPTWGKLWLARLIGQGVNIIFVDALPKLLDPRKKNLPKDLAEGAAAKDSALRTGQERITYWIGDKTRDIVKNFTTNEAALEKAQWWGYIVSLETLCTRITSGVLHGLVALGKKHEEKQIAAHEAYCAEKHAKQDAQNGTNGALENAANTTSQLALQSIANQIPESPATGADRMNASLAQRGTSFADKYAVPSEVEVSNVR